MSKIICDVCGTSYPETSTQCPICGCVRPAETVAVGDDNQESGGYTYVKGGRFSKTNVRKRNQGINPAPVTPKENKPINKKALGLLIVLACLLLIVVFMIVYIVSSLPEDDGPDQQQTQTTDVPCTGLKLSKLDFSMGAVNEALKLEAICSPSDTTDKVEFKSSNEAVVTVSENGTVVCVGAGQAVITVTCGDQLAECRVTCTLEEPEASDPEETTVPTVNISLSRKHIDDANFKGERFFLYLSGDVAATELTWISEDTSVATVDANGIVYAEGEGETIIRAEYNGVTVASCPITCIFKDETMEGEDSPEGGNPGTEAGSYVLHSHYGDPLPFEEDKNAYSVTLALDEWVGLYLQDSVDSSKTAKPVWTIIEGDCILDPDGAGVTANSDVRCKLKAEYEGVVYYLIVY